VVLWDPAHGYRKPAALDSDQRAVYGVALSPDGSTLAAAGSDGQVVLWDAAPGYRKLAALDSGQRAVNAVAFSPDGSTLAAAGDEGKVALWDFFGRASSDEESFPARKAKVCGLVHGNLAKAESKALAPGLDYYSTTCPD
jgi:WD40 repeat protein